MDYYLIVLFFGKLRSMNRAGLAGQEWASRGKENEEMWVVRAEEPGAGFHILWLV
jgi:hypothetical protein